ncbi:ureidoglycolate lyase [Acidihalobacter ferrooxydans]|uniref:ureidoglycolate lyase n=1 Tax=Acidihalobacter ferrooxydans TaxID=1765967 RepID=UPI0009FAF578|nr:ureidoglycolate lyase [Acidihalobacter ferrooxydans]
MPAPEDVRAYVIDGGRGINLAPGVWHHPLISMADGDYLVIERADPSRNLEVHTLSASLQLSLWAEDA